MGMVFLHAWVGSMIYFVFVDQHHMFQSRGSSYSNFQFHMGLEKIFACMQCSSQWKIITWALFHLADWCFGGHWTWCSSIFRLSQRPWACSLTTPTRLRARSPALPCANFARYWIKESWKLKWCFLRLRRSTVLTWTLFHFTRRRFTGRRAWCPSIFWLRQRPDSCCGSISACFWAWCPALPSVNLARNWREGHWSQNVIVK